MKRIPNRIPELDSKVIWNIFLSILALIIFIFSSFNVFFSMSQSDKESDFIIIDDFTEIDKENQVIISGSAPEHTRGGGVWTFSEELEFTMELGKGSDSYIKISPEAPEGKRMSIKPELNPNEFLSTTALTALAQSPSWLQANLTNKFIDLAQTEWHDLMQIWMLTVIWIW
jgi:hypothetical protein